MDHSFASRNHLCVQFALLDLLLKRHIFKLRSGNDIKNEYAGLVVSEEEIDSFFNETISETHETENEDILKIYDTSIEIKRKEIADLEEKEYSNGNTLPLCNLQEKFRLSSFHIEILLIALAPEINSKYEKIFAYIQNDVTRKLPTIELVSLLLNNQSELYQTRDFFNNGSPLIDFDLIEIVPEPSRPYTPFPSRYIKVNAHVLNYLFGVDSNDEMLDVFTIKTSPVSDIFLDPNEPEICKILDCINGNGTISQIIYLQGLHSNDKKEIAGAVCSKLYKSHLMIFRDPFSDEGTCIPVLKKIFREALLTESALYFDSWIFKHIESSSLILQKIIHYIEQTALLVFFSGEQTWEPGRLVKKAVFHSIKIDFPSYEEQKCYWKMALNGYYPKNGEETFSHIQSVFKLSRTQIYDAASTAIRFSQNNNETTAVLNFEDVYSACRIHSSTRMGNLARKTTPKHGWDDIVLPNDKLMQLKELCNSIKYRSIVYEKWGFNRKLSLGKGISALFAGASGTGKTMAAEILANELHVDLYKIDLSSIVSKYIGETEKNLATIFDEAENSNSILFFDEADAIMGKRSEVKDAHDRYSNIETAFLLQKMEEYSGVSLLATNFRQNIDNAFVRRIRFIIEFPFPDFPLRKDIWKKIWAPGVPLSDDIDIDFIANQFEFSGGNIRNIALNSAFFAAEHDSEVEMKHILRAVKRELQKTGKICIDQDFGKYQHLIKNNMHTGVVA